MSSSPFDEISTTRVRSMWALLTDQANDTVRLLVELAELLREERRQAATDSYADLREVRHLRWMLTRMTQARLLELIETARSLSRLRSHAPPCPTPRRVFEDLEQVADAPPEFGESLRDLIVLLDVVEELDHMDRWFAPIGWKTLIL